MQLPPSIGLSHFIKHYLFLNKEDKAPCALRLFADGNTGFVFYTGQQLTLNNNPLPHAFVYGQIADFKDIVCHGPVSLFIVVFRPDGFNRLFNLPASECKDKVIPLSDLFGSRGHILENAVLDCGLVSKKIALAESFFYQQPPVTNPLVTAALDFIIAQKGQVAVHHLAAFTGYHPRQLERVFATSIGLSPKKFSTIVRAHVFLRHLQSAPVKSRNDGSPNLTGYAYDSGYYDQAHLIREFKHISGLTPTQYLKTTAPLAINFLQLSGQV